MSFHTLGSVHFETTDCLLCQYISNEVTEQLKKITRDVTIHELVVVSHDQYSHKPMTIYVIPDHDEDTTEEANKVMEAIRKRLPSHADNIVVKPSKYRRAQRGCRALFMWGSAFQRLYY